MNVCSIWPFAQNSDDFYYLDIWQCARYFVAVGFNYHHRNVRSRVSVSVSVSNFQVSISVSAFMTKSRSRTRLEIWARSRSRRLRSRLYHWYEEFTAWACEIQKKSPECRATSPNQEIPATMISHHQECPKKDWRGKPCWLHPRESGLEFVKELGGVTTSPTLLGLVLMRS